MAAVASAGAADSVAGVRVAGEILIPIPAVQRGAP